MRAHLNRRNILLFILFLAMGLIGLYYWLASFRYVSTEDAYVNADVVQLSARVTGQVVRVAVENNQHVSKGQVLFVIDPQPFEIAFQKAKANLAMEASVLNINQITADRVASLFQKNVTSKQDYDEAQEKLKAAIASQDVAKNNLRQAELNLSYTQVTAPTSGWVTNLNLQPGNIVEAHWPLFALISDQRVWIDANFKETKLEKIKPGQLVTIRSDMYPNHLFKGRVESISGGTGAAFSLLPPQNATGNWVKITQRVPVRILVLDPSKQYPLRIGTSTEVVIER